LEVLLFLQLLESHFAHDSMHIIAGWKAFVDYP
jgi:hypothetical protein